MIGIIKLKVGTPSLLQKSFKSVIKINFAQLNKINCFQVPKKKGSIAKPSHKISKEGQMMSGFLQKLEQFAHPNTCGKHIGYGTAGFRDKYKNCI